MVISSVINKTNAIMLKMQKSQKTNCAGTLKLNRKNIPSE
jgi:hypothetical protein